MEAIPTPDKVEVRKRIKDALMVSHPEDAVHLTNATCQKVARYIKGYVNCMNEFAETPMNETEVRQHLDNEMMEEFYHVIGRQRI